MRSEWWLLIESLSVLRTAATLGVVNEWNGLASTVMLEAEATRMDTHDPNDPLSVYIREVCNVEPLTEDEEAKLFRQLGARADWMKPARTLPGSSLKVSSR